MRSSPSLIFALLLAGLLFGAATTTQAQRVAAAPKASTLGLGADVTVGLSSSVNVRVGGAYFPVSRSGVLQSEVDVQYDVNGRLGAAQVVLDWHPFQNAFRLSLGAVYNDTRAKGQAHPLESYTVQQKTFRPERLGNLDAEVSFANKLNPYLGIGFGNAVQGSLIDVFVDLGVLYVAQPEIDLSGKGLISATRNHEPTLNEGLRSFHFLPFFALGVSTRL